MNKLFIALLFISSVVTLNASEKDLQVTNQQWLKDLKVLVSMSSEKVDKLQGKDKNHNGIRDDVESYVLSKYSDDPFQRDVFFKAAKKIQKIISLPLKENKDEHIKLDRELLDIYTCRDYILYRNEVKDIEQELLNKTLFKGKVLNTTDRLRAYINHKKILPADFDDLSDAKLQSDKKSCLKLYNSYNDEVKESTTLTIK